jgi:macrolide-specific efflux system membrane fusion protein
VEIADLSDLQVSGQFSEADALKVKKGQPATVTLNADTGTTIPAEVSLVDPQATTTNDVVQYGVTLKLKSAPSGLRLGQTASVEVVTAKADNALYVPSTAVKSAGGTHTVTVLANGKQATRTVRVGVAGDDNTQITSGLRAGEKVVLPTQATGGGFPSGGFPGLNARRAGGGGQGGGRGGAGGGPR